MTEKRNFSTKVKLVSNFECRNSLQMFLCKKFIYFKKIGRNCERRDQSIRSLDKTKKKYYKTVKLKRITCNIYYTNLIDQNHSIQSNIFWCVTNNLRKIVDIISMNIMDMNQRSIYII